MGNKKSLFIRIIAVLAIVFSLLMVSEIPSILSRQVGIINVIEILLILCWLYTGIGLFKLKSWSRRAIVYLSAISIIDMFYPPLYIWKSLQDIDQIIIYSLTTILITIQVFFIFYFTRSSVIKQFDTSDQDKKKQVEREASKKKLFAVASIILFAILVIPGNFMRTAGADIVLFEGVGMEGYELNKSTVDDILSTFGEPDYIEETAAEYSVNYLYFDMGIKFNLHGERLNTISTLPNYGGMTSQGLSLASSLEDIETIYGEPVVDPRTGKYSEKAWTYPNAGLIVWFKPCLSESAFPGIDKIVIFSEHTKPYNVNIDGASRKHF